MGEYERTYKAIADLEREKKAILEEIERLRERLWEVDVEIGECTGYLAELNSIDGEDY